MVDPKWLVRGGNAPVSLHGTARYAKLSSPDQFGKFSCSIYPDQESMVKVHKLISEGVKNRLNKDDEGYRITFSRPPSIKTKTRGDIDIGPVWVKDENARDIDTSYVDDGAEITMLLETYGGPSGSGRGLYKAARLVGITVHNVTDKNPLP